MKTTIELPDALLTQAKAEASREGTTLRCLIEEGLRLILRERRKPAVPYRMADGSVPGGLTPEFEAKGGWSKIREAAYPGFFDDDDNDPDRGYGDVFAGPLGARDFDEDRKEAGGGGRKPDRQNDRKDDVEDEK